MSMAMNMNNRGAARPRPSTAVVGWVARGSSVPADLMSAVTLLDVCVSNVVATTRPRGKTNSERGRAFRARRKQYEDDLLECLSNLRKQVADLRKLHHVKGIEAVPRQGVLSRDAALGITRQYFAMFSNGLANSRQAVGYKRLLQSEHDRDLALQQIAFLNTMMDSEMRFGELSGLDVLVDQWRRYTACHSMLRVEMQDIEWTGSAEAPTTNVHVRMSVRFSRDTLTNIFPHVAADEELVQRLIGKEVTYLGYTQIHFSSQGRVVAYDADVEFVDALVKAGISLHDIAKLMNQALIQDQCFIGDVTDQRARSPPPRESNLYITSMHDEARAKEVLRLPTYAAEDSSQERKTERLDLSYILSA